MNLLITILFLTVHMAFAPIGEFCSLNGQSVQIELPRATPVELTNLFMNYIARQTIAQRRQVSQRLVNIINGGGPLNGPLDPGLDGEIRGQYVIDELPRLGKLHDLDGFRILGSNEHTDHHGNVFRVVEYTLNDDLTIWFKIPFLRDENSDQFTKRIGNLGSIREIIPLSTKIAFTDRGYEYGHKALTTDPKNTEVILHALFHQSEQTAPKNLGQLAEMLTALGIESASQQSYKAWLAMIGMATMFKHV